MLKTIDYQEYYQLMVDNDQLNFLKTKEYAQAREQMGWATKILGCFDNDTLIGACILHAKKLPKINSYLFYIPRGIVVNFHNDEHLELFTKDLYQYGKEHRAYSIRIDPEIPAYIDGELNPLIKKLKSLGYKHLGLANNFEGTQPRCTIINDFANKTYEEVYSNYEKRCQKHITNALHNGITIVKSSVDDLDDFMEIMNDTASRGGYITRTREYFEILLKAYQEHMKMYFAYFDPKKIDLASMKNDINQLHEQIKRNEIAQSDEGVTKKGLKKLKADNIVLHQALDKQQKNYNLVCDIVTNYPQGIKLATALYVEYENKAWYWFGGSRTMYRELNPVFAMFDQYIQDIMNKNITYFDFLGISGNINNSSDPNYGLYQFKKSFGGDVVEFVGEFDLVINKPIYHVATRLLTMAQSSKKNPLLEKLLKVVNKH